MTTPRLSPGGSGLGIPICIKLVELMGGTLGVTSKVRVGSTFGFTLPLEVIEPYSPSAILHGLTIAVRLPAREHGLISRMARALGAKVVDSESADVDIAVLDPELADRCGTRVPCVHVCSAGAAEVSPAQMKRDRDLFRPVGRAAFIAAITEVRDSKTHATQTGPLEPRWLRQPRVLLAEDNAVNRMVACKILERLGCHVEAVEDGVRAVEAVSKCDNIDLVFMDLQMPGLDGLHATARIRALEGTMARVPIVALTANTGTRERDACRAAGMNEFLSKPFMIETLSALMHGLLPQLLAPPVDAGGDSVRPSDI